VRAVTLNEFSFLVLIAGGAAGLLVVFVIRGIRRYLGSDHERAIPLVVEGSAPEQRASAAEASVAQLPSSVVPEAVRGSGSFDVKRSPPKPAPVQTPRPAPASPTAPPERTFASRKRKPPEDDYRRHIETPGWLYIARNSMHRENIFKVGYTTVSPEGRAFTLNESRAGSTSECGVLELVDAVEVQHSYEAEQAAFARLARWRMASKREFFNVPLAALKAAIRSQDVGASTADRAQLDETKDEISAIDISTFAGRTGWVFFARNPCYRPNIVRLAHTEKAIFGRMEELNAAQRSLTAEIGFYRVVHARWSDSPKAAKERTIEALRSRRIDPRKHFFDGPWSALKDALDKATEPRPVVVRVADVVDPMRLPSEVRPWVLRCPKCDTPTLQQGQINEIRAVQCPRCHTTITCCIGPSGTTALDEP
jgi:hypothetical protein